MRLTPKGVDTTWRTFLSAHLDCMVATDFFCKSVWTPMGKRVAYTLMFIHLGSRKVFVSPSTYHPTADWMQQQARNVTLWAGSPKKGGAQKRDITNPVRHSFCIERAGW